jgi:CubicO group peptidase (beta-lactamase class C family)
MSGPVVIDPFALSELLEPYDREDAPGFAVGVAQAGTPYFRRGVGMASIELPVRLSPTIRMRIGSTSKHFTALAILLLQEEGLLSIYDSPRAFVSELPGWSDRMTLLQLMDHTSGMRCSLDLLLHSAGPGIPTPPDYHLQTLAGFRTLNFAPGTSWNYNNGAYALLAEIVVRVARQPFADFMAERIFRPIGMNDTLVRSLDTDLVPNSATLHVPSPTGGYTRGVFGAPISGEGAIASTVDDMLAWLAHMDEPIVGSKETWEAMRTATTDHGYGLGLITRQHRGLEVLHHPGVVFGGSCQMLKVVDHKLDIVVITNGLGGLDLANLTDAIVDRCVPDLPPALTDTPGESPVGTFYAAEAGRRITLGTLGGMRTIRTDGTILPILRQIDGSLVAPLSVTGLCVRSQSGDDTVLVEDCGRQTLFQRVSPPVLVDYAALAGCYDAEDLTLTAAISADEASARLTLSSPFGELDYELTIIGLDLWEGRVVIALPAVLLLEVIDDGILLTTGRTQRLKLLRRLTNDAEAGSSNDVSP